MDRRQLDLFAPSAPVLTRAPPPLRQSPLTPSALTDTALVAALATASSRDCVALAAEAGKRRLAQAVPALAALCRRFTAWGDAVAPVPEQAAALDALRRIGGRAAGMAVAEGIAKNYFIDPTLGLAAAAAATLGATLSEAAALRLLQHDSAALRGDACRCVPNTPAVTTALLALLDDLRPEIVQAAACALGRRNRAEARPVLCRLLDAAPNADIIEALGVVVDEDGLIRLSRLAGHEPGLADAVLDALETSDHPRAASLAARVSSLRSAASASRGT